MIFASENVSPMKLFVGNHLFHFLLSFSSWKKASKYGVNFYWMKYSNCLLHMLKTPLSFIQIKPWITHHKIYFNDFLFFSQLPNPRFKTRTHAPHNASNSPKTKKKTQTNKKEETNKQFNKKRQPNREQREIRKIIHFIHINYRIIHSVCTFYRSYFINVKTSKITHAFAHRSLVLGVTIQRIVVIIFGLLFVLLSDGFHMGINRTTFPKFEFFFIFKPDFESDYIRWMNESCGMWFFRRTKRHLIWSRSNQFTKIISWTWINWFDHLASILRRTLKNWW